MPIHDKPHPMDWGALIHNLQQQIDALKAELAKRP